MYNQWFAYRSHSTSNQNSYENQNHQSKTGNSHSIYIFIRTTATKVSLSTRKIFRAWLAQIAFKSIFTLSCIALIILTSQTTFFSQTLIKLICEFTLPSIIFSRKHFESPNTNCFSFATLTYNIFSIQGISIGLAH